MDRTAISARVWWRRHLPLLAAVALPACTASAPADKAQAPGPSEPSEAERLAFAKSVVASYEAKDRPAFDDKIDWQAIYQIASAGLNMSGKELGELAAGMRASARGDYGFTASMIKDAEEGWSFQFLGARRRQGRTVLLFRKSLQGGIAYYEYVPRRFPDGKVRAADIYVYLAGEYLSDAFRRIMLPAVAERSRNILDKLVAGEKDYVQDFPQLARAGRLVSQEKWAEAMAIYRTLRPGTLRDKAVLVGRLRAAQALGDREHLAVLEEFERLYPNDPCLDLISIGVFRLKNDIPGALKAIDQLDRSVGGDPYLDVLRAHFHEAGGDLKAAEDCVRRAIERDSTLLDAHLTLLDLDLKQRKYKDALARMKVIEARFDMVFEDLEQQEECAGFVKSPQYAEWLEYCKTRAKPAPAQQVSPAAKRSSPE